MALVTMPNGEVVDVADDTPPDVLAKIKSQYSGTRKDRVAAGQPRTTDKQPTATIGDSVMAGIRQGLKLPILGSLSDDQYRGVESGATFGFKDELAGGIAKLGGGDYTTARDAERAKDKEAEERSPIGYNAADIAASMLVPIGGEGRILAKGGELLGKVLPGAGRVVSRGAERLASSGVLPKTIVAGAEQGALNAAGHSQEFSDIPNNAIVGAGIGAAAGGLLGGATNLATKGAQALKDRGVAAAERKAYERVGSLLDNSGMTPADARLEMLRTENGGGDAMLADLTPGTRAEAVQLARKPSLPSSNTLIERAQERIEARPGRFADEARNAAGMPEDLNALNHTESINADRQMAGKSDYASGGVMDKPLKSTPEMDKFFMDAPPITQDALKSGYADMLNRRENPAVLESVGPMRNEAGEPFISYIPNMRTLDYAKRAFNEKIGIAIKSGNTQDAEALSNELTDLKKIIGDANPEYLGILKTQRDAFQQLKATEIGSTVLQRIQKGSTEARKVASELRQLPKDNVDDARIGIVDALVNMDSKANPVGLFNAMARSPQQRQVLEFAFGGKTELDKFSRWIRRERRSQAVDNANAPGRQSITSTAEMAALDAEDSGADKVMTRAASGWAYGGPGGAVMNAIRTVGDLATKPSKVTQEAIAKILLSKGEGLQQGVRSAKEFAGRRAARNLRRARGVGRAAADYYTNLGGG